MTPITVTCPQCAVKLPVTEDLLGRNVRCGNCATTFIARADAEPIARPAARPARAVESNTRPSNSRQRRVDDGDDDDDRSNRARSRTRRSPTRNSTNPIGIIVAVVAGIFIVASVGLGYFLMRPVVRNPAARDLMDLAAAPVAAGPPAAAEPLTAVMGKELSAETLRKVKAATVRIDVMLSSGDQGSGSGFLIHPEGLFVTNAHVVGYSRQDGNRPARTVSIVLNGGEKDERRVRAVVFGADGDADLAVLRVPPGTTLPAPLTIGPVSGLRETQELYVFGYPLGDVAGKEITVSTTTISSLRKENGMLTALQVNGGMHPGNSGGPLTDRSGQVVAVAVAGIKGTTINFAIPGDQVEPFVRQQIAEGGKIKPATVTGRPKPSDDLPPFLPPSRLRPPFGPPGFPTLPQFPFSR